MLDDTEAGNLVLIMPTLAIAEAEAALGTQDNCLDSAELPLRPDRIRASLALDHLNFKEDDPSRSWEASSSLKFM